MTARSCAIHYSRERSNIVMFVDERSPLGAWVAQLLDLYQGKEFKDHSNSNFPIRSANPPNNKSAITLLFNRVFVVTCGLMAINV